MTQTSDSQKRMITLGNGTELQEWKVERLSDGTFEYHIYIGQNFSKVGGGIYSKGAVWMLFRVTNPNEEDVEQTTEYRMGNTGTPTSGNDLAQTEWDGRVAATYYRFDQVLQEFFS